MEFRTLEGTWRQQGPSIGSINGCSLTKLQVEIEDLNYLRSPTDVDSTFVREAEAQPHSTGMTTVLGSIADTKGPSEAKEALLLKALCEDDIGDSDSALQVQQKICLPFQKKLRSSQLLRILGRNQETAANINYCSLKNASIVQGNSKVMLEFASFASEFVPCARVTISPVSCSWKCFTFEEIRDATKNFHEGNVVGKGAFANVYKGTLPGGQIIAIKKFNHSNTAEPREKEFLVEIGIMAHVRHRNITPLLGFCLEGGLYLIYTFLANGSLTGILHGTKSKSFNWCLRYKVAVGIAEGLLYLHEQCQRRIIHRDIKASNILLNDDFEPQISDFGLAKWLPKDWSHHSVCPVEGTFGYLAPEYHKHGIVDEKIDVYSFGVLLLELVTGRHPVNNNQQCLVHWAQPLLETQKIGDFVDSELRGCYNLQQIQSLIATAETCVRQSSISRPPMNQVVRMLRSTENFV